MANGSYHGTEISKYYQSFSGTDTLAFIMLPGCNPVLIGSLTTISYSMYRNKKPVINIGRTNINGVTRGSRIYAGTMIFTLINQHWLRELQEQPEASWISSYEELKVDEMPLFDIMIISANEYGNCISMYIWGIDVTDEAQTISVEDLFTENTFSFIARDITIFKKFNVFNNKNGGTSSKTKVGDSQRYYVLDSNATSLDDVAALEREFTLAKLEAKKERNSRKYETLSRDLYFSSSKTMMGNDVAKLQEALNKTKDYELKITGIFDDDTDKAVRDFQSNNGFTVDGIVNFKLYNAIISNNDYDGEKLAVVVNKSGAYVYDNPMNNANIVDTKPYREQVAINGIVTGFDDVSRYYKTSTGYISVQDMYSAYYTSNTVEFPTIKYGDENSYVTMVQSMLSNIYSDVSVTGTYDLITEKYIKKLQEENGLIGSGVIDYQTWLLLQSLDGESFSSITSDNFRIKLNRLPGDYSLKDNLKDTIKEYISEFFATASCDNYINIKYSAVAIYADGTSKTYSSTIPVKEEAELTLMTFINAFLYNIDTGTEPTQVDFVIYPYNKKPYKWTIKL